MAVQIHWALATAAVGLLAAMSSAQLSVPAHTSTAFGANTVGFCFQAPVDFVVTGVRVPDESNQGTQTVAIYDLASAPASLPAATAATPAFFAAGVSSRAKITVYPPLSVQKGRWLCVLGACGATSGTVATSLGAQPHASWVLRHDITLQRLVMAGNAATNAGVGSISADPSSRVGLGRVLVSIQGGGEAEELGVAAKSGGKTGPDTSRPPDIGREGGVLVSGGSGTNNGGWFLIGPTPTQTPIAGLGTLYVHPAGAVVLGLGGAIPSRPQLLKFAIPNHTALVGQMLYFQSLIDKVGAFELTNGLRWTVGR